MATYMICDQDGYALTDGLQSHEVRQVAQEMANEREEPVWFSQSDADGMGVRINPNIVGYEPDEEYI